MDVVVVPAYNEEYTIRKVLLGALQYCSSVVVVNDGSSDRTKEVVEEVMRRHPEIRLLSHVINMGKGAALKTGTEFAVNELKAGRIVFLDADLQHRPEDIPRMLGKLSDADIVFGCRRLDRRMPLLFRVGNAVLNLAIRVLYGVRIPDSQSGYRAFLASAYPKIRWDATDYSVESEIIANVGRHRLRYAVLPIETIYNDRYKGTTITDGMKIVFDMVVWKFR